MVGCIIGAAAILSCFHPLPVGALLCLPIAIAGIGGVLVVPFIYAWLIEACVADARARKRGRSDSDEGACAPVRRESMTVRTHGESGPLIIALHGGPAAVGGAAPIARGLSEWFQVLEPWQRGSGDEPLTVARHVGDLHELISSRCAGVRPALVGTSWGAMLALAYAAEHPESAGPLVLVGNGTFDLKARAQLAATIEERQSGEMRERMARLKQDFPNEDERMQEKLRLARSVYEYDPIDLRTFDGDGEPFDMKAHVETWDNMLRLQSEGVYPAAFEAITSPVIMLHGAYDPHPGRMIYEGLKPTIPQLEYREWERCGHSPWAERQVRGEFLAVMRRWLLARCET